MNRTNLASFRPDPALPRHSAMLMSPWLIFGSALILGLAISFWAAKNTLQEQENMSNTLVERAGTLMWAVEGGARAGMGIQRTGSYLQFILQEIARQPDIIYMAVLSPEGTIIAHSDPAYIGQTLYASSKGMNGIAPHQSINWRIVNAKNNGRVFEAFRVFAPLPGAHGHGGHMRGRFAAEPGQRPLPQFLPQPEQNMRLMRGKRFAQDAPPPGIFAPAPPPGGTSGAPSGDISGNAPGVTPGTPSVSGQGSVSAEKKGSALPDPLIESLGGPDVHAKVKQSAPVIVIGLDMAPYEQNLLDAKRSTLFTAILVGLLGIGGMLSLFWAHNYRHSRQLLLNIRAIAHEVENSMPLGLILADETGAIDAVNPAAERLLGRSQAEVIATDPRLASLGDIDWEEITARVKSGHSVLEEEYLLTRPSAHAHGEANGKADAEAEAHTIPVSISASRITNDEGESLGVMYLLRDLREVKRLQAELRRSERLSTLGNMAARVAHEIRNPLSSIKGFATYLGTRVDAEADKEAAKTMIGEVDRLNRVVSELLDFARPSNLSITPVAACEVLDRAARLAALDAKAKGVSLNLAPSAPEITLAVDAERITQAFLNLLLNAVQATPAGGSITLGVEDKVVEKEGRKRAAIRIEDTGSGMDAEVLTQVFNPYFTTKAKGTGLGLSIVTKIVEDHYGDIAITSTPGAGTTVTVWLPVAQAETGGKQA